MHAMLTGHRVVNDNCLNLMRSLVRALIVESEGDLVIISGGNLGTPDAPTGADRMWALAAHEERVPYHIYVPAGYGANYYGRNPSMLDRFERMLAGAEKVVLIGDITKPFDWRNNFVRNTAMAEAADHYVVCSTIEPNALRRETRGGTAHGVKSIYAKGARHVDWIHADGSGITRQHDLG